jgi:dihydroorotase
MIDSGLAGRVAVVTGSSRGIGLGIAERLAELGCVVIMNGRHADTMRAAAAAIRRSGVTVDEVVADVGRFDDVQRLVRHVLDQHGRIATIGLDLQGDGQTTVVNLGGQLVLPGLVDLHAHVFDGVGDSVAADVNCLGRGTVTVVDGGSAGAFSIDAFRRVARSCRADVLAWMNLSTIGLIDTSVGELVMGPYLNPEAAVAAARRHPGFVVGIKARLSTYAAGAGAVRVLRALRQVADELALPVMVHVGDTTEPLEELLGFLGPGDVVTHALTGRKHGVLRADGSIRSGILDAQRAGIVFDAARGRNHLSFDVLSGAAEQGFLPDTLSTDLTVATAGDVGYGLATLATYLLGIGVPLHDVIVRLTVRPAAVVGRERPTALAAGQPADLTLVAVRHGRFTLEDVDGRRMSVERILEPTGTVRAGVYAAIPRRAA